MPSTNRIIIASAGSGKTSHIVGEALSSSDKRTALITYTLNSTAELKDKTESVAGVVPPHISVQTWFGFLLKHFVRPYQREAVDFSVNEMCFVNGQSAMYARETNTSQFYFTGQKKIYSDKVSQFACKIIESSGGKSIKRLEQIFNRVFIDEAQDLAGYDLELIEHLLGSSIEVVLVGDVRQATYKTNHSRKNRQFSGSNIVNKFSIWERAGKASIAQHNYSYRCVQNICNFADKLYPELADTVSRNAVETGHDGVFAIKKKDVGDYVREYNPQTLRLDRRTSCDYGNPLNYGSAKGMTFERTLLFPHGNLLRMVQTGDVSKLGSAAMTIAKVYVGLTRARQSVGIVIPNNVQPVGVELWQND